MERSSLPLLYSLPPPKKKKFQTKESDSPKTPTVSCYLEAIGEPSEEVVGTALKVSFLLCWRRGNAQGSTVVFNRAVHIFCQLMTFRKILSKAGRLYNWHLAHVFTATFN